MNAELLLAHFHRISDAPNVVPRLRGLILDLAIRGKLVEQRLTDEPAAGLLTQIRSEKARLVKDGKLRRETQTRPLEIDEQPFPLPARWEWVRLIDILLKLTDGTHHSPPNLAQGEFKYITAKNIKPEGVSFDEITYVSGDVHREVYSRCNPEKGDILYIKDGATTGIVTINNLDEPFTMLSSVALLKLPHCVYNRLLVEFLRSPFFYLQMRGFMKGAAITRVTLKRMAPALIPLPPLPEQKRIVAKVDELMALCDRLEAAQRERESRRDLLTASAHHHLTNGGDEETLRSHVQFFIGHLPRLTVRPDQVKQLRQTILNLAVRGRLLPQSHADEPATELLKRIQRWRIDAENERRIRQPRKTLAGLRSSDAPYSLPSGWSWARLGTLIYIHSGDGLTTESMRVGSIPVFGGNGITGYHDTPNVLKPSIVIGRVGYYCGSIHVTPAQAWVTDNAFITEFSSENIFDRFLAILLRATDLKENEKATAQPVISGSKVYPIVVGLPPLAEQRRIVAKIDQLMALCDQLDALLATAQTEASRTLESVLHNALHTSAEAVSA